jgi:hypothetical protein
MLIDRLHPHYVVNEQGQRIQVLLSIRDAEALEGLVEDMVDAAVARDRLEHERDQAIPLDDFMAELERDGLL